MASTKRYRLTQNETSGAALNTPFEIKQNAVAHSLCIHHTTASETNPKHIGIGQQHEYDDGHHLRTETTEIRHHQKGSCCCPFANQQNTTYTPSPYKLH